MLRLINGLIKKSDQLWLIQSVIVLFHCLRLGCFYGTISSSYVGRTDCFHGKALGNITLILFGR